MSVRTYERNLFVALICVLVGFGTLMVHSASVTSWPTEFEQVYLSRHLVFLAIAVGAAVVAAHLPAEFWFRAAPWLYAATLMLLGLVLIPGVGTSVNGAQRWLRYGPVSFQPSELAKITLPLLVGRMLTLRRERLGHWFAGTVPVALPVALIVPLVAVQPDLGTALFLALVGAVAMFVGGWPIRHFIFAAAAAVPPAVYLVNIEPYQVRRITGFLAAWSDFDRAPYQLKQSLVSLGAGGVWGVGLGKGWQKLSFLPEANTDFVFAVVGEELGLIGTLSLILVWAALYITGLRLLRRFDRRSFRFVAGFTLLTQLALQAVINVAVVTGMIPPKGIPHPLLSYGGSSLLVTLTALGIVLSLARETGPVEDAETV